jgi:hypothetical protein
VRTVRAGKDSRTPKEPDFRENEHLIRLVLAFLDCGNDFPLSLFPSSVISQIGK